MSNANALTDLPTASSGILTMQAQLIRHIGRPLLSRWKDKGAAVFNGALSNFGRWRGEQLRSRHSEYGLPSSAGALALYWDNCDLHFARVQEGIEIEVVAGRVELSLKSDPVTLYLGQFTDITFADTYNQAVFSAVVAAYNPDIKVSFTRSDGLNIIFESMDAATNIEPIEELLSTSAVVRKSANLFGALYYFLAQEILTRLGDSGEEHLREATRTLARERGKALRDEHLANGHPINLESLLRYYDSPIANAFEWADAGVLTPTQWYQDCTYCPFFDVWKELGGQRIGWIYDEELHPALYRAYDPGLEFKFSKNKNLGDKVCGFRVDFTGDTRERKVIVDRKL